MKKGLVFFIVLLFSFSLINIYAQVEATDPGISSVPSGNGDVETKITEVIVGFGVWCEYKGKPGAINIISQFQQGKNIVPVGKATVQILDSTGKVVAKKTTNNIGQAYLTYYDLGESFSYSVKRDKKSANGVIVAGKSFYNVIIK